MRRTYAIHYLKGKTYALLARANVADERKSLIALKITKSRGKIGNQHPPNQ
jgi:hypothetical protein